MKQAPLRILRIVLVGTGAYAAYLLLEPLGLGWLVLPAGLLLVIAIFGRRFLRARRFAREVAREEGWSAAVVDGARRPAAIAEVRAAVAEAQSAADRVRLTVLLSDLIDAEGDRKGSRALLEGLDLATLPAIEGAVVRHARATLLLRDGEAEAAQKVLRPRVPRCGDMELDRRLELLDAMVDVELGEAERALETANRIRQNAGSDQALAVEARVVRAAALDATGQRADAIRTLTELGPQVVEALVDLGGPRIRELAEEASEARGS
jgi:hypothetical protein